jgi:hypothetical protein
MKRSNERKAKRQADKIVSTAKKDMLDWVESLGYVPTQEEMQSWQAGYIAGINRVRINSGG